MKLTNNAAEQLLDEERKRLEFEANAITDPELRAELLSLLAEYKTITAVPTNSVGKRSSMYLTYYLLGYQCVYEDCCIYASN